MTGIKRHLLTYPSVCPVCQGKGLTTVELPVKLFRKNKRQVLQDCKRRHIVLIDLGSPVLLVPLWIPYENAVCYVIIL